MAGIRVWSIVVGVVAVLVGWTLLFRPFASLTVLLLLVVVGLLVMAGSRLAELERPWAALDLVPATAYLLAAVAVLVWPGSAVVVLVWVVGLSLLVDGVVALVHAVRDRGPGRITSALRGTATVVLGVLALSWPDVTSIVVAVVFGIRVLWTGLELVWQGVRGRTAGRPTGQPAPAGPRPWWRRSLSFVAAAATLVLAVALAGVGSLVSNSTPVPDDFYTAPEDVPGEPGALLRTDDFDRAIPDGARAWRILYTTTALGDEPALASAIVVVPDDAGAAPLPVVAWAHGTTGVAEGCAPSLLADPFEAGAMFTLDEAIGNDWAVVATDYVGLGTEGPHAYLVGEPAGHAVLDAVRAARAVEEISLADRTVVWGHSQGGHAALWAGILAEDHAPDAGVVGVAAMAPASNLTGLITNLDEVPGGSIFASYVLDGFASTYDDVDVDDYVRGAAEVQVEEMATRCLSGPGALVNIAEYLVQDTSVFDTDPTSGALGARLEENVPAGPIAAPLLLAQGETDPLVIPSAQQEYADQRCDSGGGPVDYRTYPDRDHVGVVADDSPLVPDLLEWTRQRFAGEEAADTCG
ncbi:lipase family protein [Nocardioides sediminis]|uniref:lipase family protein n=1 Tax=Nocardioides sediminis TaxID=433648 RepID=UPI000D2FC977|nr:lipase family protein [Nocardioides sediminis]